MMKMYMPEKSNFYGYCNNFNYVPKTLVFPHLFQILATRKNPIAELREAIATYENLYEMFTDYENFTELVVIVNLLSWDLHKENTEVASFLSDEYYRLRDRFYELFEDKTARQYFWEMTD